MSAQNNSIFVRVKDMAGNAFVCPIDALKNPGEISDADLDKCVDDATVERYAGNIKIAE